VLLFRVNVTVSLTARQVNETINCEEKYMLDHKKNIMHVYKVKAND
jgi:hemerythrin superfamily protein